MILPNGDIRDFWMGHRLVVLPDYQGLGIGTKFNDWCGEYFLSQGLKYYVKTAHFKLKDYYKKNDFWDIVNEECRKFKKGDLKYKTSLKEGINPLKYDKPFKLYDQGIGQEGKMMAHWINRPLISARYLGKDYIEKPHKYIVFEAELNTRLTKETLSEIIDKEHYWEVICDDTKNNGITTLVCHEFGLQSNPLYYNNFHNVKKHYSDDLIYVYDDKHKQLLEEMKKLNVECIEKKNDTYYREESIFDF